MPLTNYRDLSRGSAEVGAGFQFEFFCGHCAEGHWKSPLKPYRMGRITGLFTRLTYLIDVGRSASHTTGHLAYLGSGRAHAKALGDAMRHAQTLYVGCPMCKKTVCRQDCWNPAAALCRFCAEVDRPQAEAAAPGGGSARAADAVAGVACPSCRSPMSGGRFCAECGYDMAATHKTCPSCGLMLLRQARFCPDCGHGF